VIADMDNDTYPHLCIFCYRLWQRAEHPTYCPRCGKDWRQRTLADVGEEAQQWLARGAPA
jgi:predicted amidophosphoribosyltransferase